MCAKTQHQRVVRSIGFETPSAQDRPALIHLCPCASGIRGVYWCTTCGQFAQHAAGKKSRAIGSVNECPWQPDTCRSRRSGARRKGTLSPKASADWPLTRDTVSISRDSADCHKRVKFRVEHRRTALCLLFCGKLVPVTCEQSRLPWFAAGGVAYNTAQLLWLVLAWTCSALNACSNDTGRFMW